MHDIRTKHAICDLHVECCDGNGSHSVHVQTNNRFWKTMKLMGKKTINEMVQMNQNKCFCSKSFNNNLCSLFIESGCAAL